MTQHGTGNITDERLDWLHERQEQAYELLTYFQEGQTVHYFGRRDGRLRPLTPEQAREARLNGVEMQLPQTALLTREDE